MIMISLIAAAVATAQYQYSPPAASPPSAMPSNPSQSSGQGDVEAVVVKVYGKCFQAADAETKAAPANVKQQKFDACRHQHDAIVKHVTAKLESSEARRVQRALHKALTRIENRYAQQMGVVLPAGGN